MVFTNLSKIVFLALLACSLGLSSCKKEEQEEKENDKEDEKCAILIIEIDRSAKLYAAASIDCKVYKQTLQNYIDLKSCNKEKKEIYQTRIKDLNCD